MQFRPILTAVATGAAALLLVACGGDDSPGGDPGVAGDPQGALEDALADAAEWAGVEATISVEGDLQALADLDGGQDIPDEVAQAFDDASIRVAGTIDGPASFLFDLDVDGATLLGMRYQEGADLLAAIDLPTVRGLLDDETERDLDDLLGMAGMFGLRDLVDAFEAGDWVAFVVPDDAFDAFEGPEEDTEPVDGDPLNDVLDVLRSDGVSVSYVEVDEHGDRLAVTVDTAEVEAALADLDPALAGSARDEDVPDEFTFDVWIADGQLARVAADISELDPDLEGAGPLVIAADLSEFDGDVDLPEAATTLDLEQMFGEMFGGMGMEMEMGEFDEPMPQPQMEPGDLPEDVDVDTMGDLEAEMEAELEAWMAEMEEMEAEMEASQ